MNNKDKIPVSNIILTVISTVLIGLFFVYISGRSAFPTVEYYPENGEADITGIDMDKNMCRLVNDWNFYPMVHYTPEDFAGGDPAGLDNDARELPYGTYHILLKTKPDTVLELAGYSIDYGTRVFINGKELLNVGYVDSDPEKAVPGSRFMRIPFYTGDGEVEIIYQYSNYFHNEGGFIQATYISSPEIMNIFLRQVNTSALLLGGGLLFLGFYFLLCAAVMKNPEYGSLALCSFVLSVRNQLFFLEYILPAGTPYSTAYRLFILESSLMPLGSMFLLLAFYRKNLSKWLKIVYTASVAVLTAVHFILDSHDLVSLCKLCYFIGLAVFVLILVLLLVRIFGKRVEWKLADTVTLVAMLIFAAGMTFEGTNIRKTEAVAHYGTSQLWLVLCILILAIVINHRNVMQERMLRKEVQRNEVLGQINTMNRDFLQNVAHELRTPLTVISGYAQLMEMQARRGKGGVEDPERLKTIRDEADRLGEMVTKLMEYTFGNTGQVEFSEIYAADLLKSSQAILKPVCAKKSNTLVTVNESSHSVHANFELLLQVIINLVVNANRHTDKGTITIRVREIPGNLEFSVADTGSGIAPDVAEHIFERGFTKDGGTGLGLAICADTMRLHGGSIRLNATGPSGSEFVFDVPSSGKV
jgi:signal transduction histidine kinase